jgi:cytochrome P450
MPERCRRRRYEPDALRTRRSYRGVSVVAELREGIVITDDRVVVMDSQFKNAAQERYAEMRSRGPIHRATILDGLECWVVVDYELAKQALTHPDLVKNPASAESALDAAGVTIRKAGTGLGVNMLNADPPDHGRLRRLVGAVFTRPRIEALRPSISRIAESLADAMTPLGHTDLVQSFTGPLPIQVICELLGIPDERRTSFRAWTTAALGSPSATQRQGFLDLNSCLAEIIEQKREALEDDVLSALIAVNNAEDGRLSAAELLGTATLLVVAGHDTTVNLMGNAVLSLFRNPIQHRWLRDRPELIASAVEEFLRFDPSVEYTPLRFAADSLVLGGVEIPRGTVVIVSLSSASRAAPGVPEVERNLLNVERQGARHLAFGHGIHHCLGAPLARLEAEIGLGTLLRRFPDLRPDVPLKEIDWIPGGLMRGPIKLPVAIGASVKVDQSDTCRLGARAVPS